MKRRITVLMCFVMILAASCAFSAEQKSKPAEAAKQKKEFTKEEYVEHIKGTLHGMPEIINMIPELKVEKDASGNEFYTYEGAKLEGLDKEGLKKILTKVQGETVRIQTERLNKQLESIRQADQASRQAQQAARVPAISIPPQIPKPPTIPTPPPVQQTPRTPPAPPPAAPRR